MGIQFIVGLGNPDKKYYNTPHNLGRALIEFIQESERLNWQKEKEFHKTNSVPSYVRLNTYMNLSGKAVDSLLKEYNCKPTEILICCDDFSLPLGTIRIRKKGSAGSHNGLKSIIEHLGADQFPRLRLGIGPVPIGTSSVDFVLNPFSKEQKKVVKQMMEFSRRAIQVTVSQGLEIAMNQFNRKINLTSDLRS